MKPTISIIVPVFNVCRYLEDCIKSILNQSFTSFEIILVNDGSEDASGQICEKYKAIDKRVKVLHQKYGGVSVARNAGLDRAEGEYIGFVDGDDRIEKDMFHELYRLSVNTASDIAICGLKREQNGIVDNAPKEVIMKELSHEEAIRELFKGTLYRFSLCNKLFKKSCFKNVRFPNGHIHEDLATTYKLFANSKKAVFTSMKGYIYIKRPNSILTSNYNAKRLDAFFAWDEILPFIEKKYPALYGEAVSCFAYWAVDNIYYVLNQVREKKEIYYHLKQIQKCLRKYYRPIIKNPSLSMTYKNVITLFYFDYRLIIVSRQLKYFHNKIKRKGLHKSNESQNKHYCPRL
ncbi:glycosyltransferase family 2 protein [Heyndrickxia acidicola]|uniref:Glycosyltransferase n=1 Tax=Heyndrickxia acidicola TaxID=209389 RepID=A0ABU6MLD8_9BACI|nr:glycosyltransferase [Heyndrickxia acidicola]MED1205207.1 glycosyltransferase [Heyndrickxia acidicola]